MTFDPTEIERLRDVCTVDDLLELCDHDLWARERALRPTQSERLADADPDQDDAS